MPPRCTPKPANFIAVHQDGALALDWEGEVLADACHDPRGRSAPRWRQAGPYFCNREIMDGFVALYIFMLAAGYGLRVISRGRPVITTPLMSGSNFVAAWCWWAA